LGALARTGWHVIAALATDGLLSHHSRPPA
jgi:hypothetical protein